MFEIVIHESAEEELNAAALYYESREAGLGEEFLKELTHSLIASASARFLVLQISISIIAA